MRVQTAITTSNYSCVFSSKGKKYVVMLKQIFIIQNIHNYLIVFSQFDFQWSYWGSQLLLIHNVEEKLSLAKFYTSLHVCNHLYTHVGSAIANLTHHSISLIPPHADTTYNLPSCYAGQWVGLWNQHPKGMKLLPSSCFLLMTHVQVGTSLTPDFNTRPESKSSC
jgi:hypothetical protein